MKHLDYLVPRGHSFKLGNQLFMINKSELEVLIAFGPALKKFMIAMQMIVHMMLLESTLSARGKKVRELIFTDLNAEHKKILHLHPHRNSRVTRIDFMVNEKGQFQIAEIDPMNKHGLGFALACRNESGHGDRQKILSYFGDLIRDYREMCIVLVRKDEFFALEQAYFAGKLSESSGKPVRIITGEDRERILHEVQNPETCFLDCPVLDDEVAHQALIDAFVAAPKRFLVPPKHWMGNKCLMAFVHEDELKGILEFLLEDATLKMLKQHVPPTFVSEPWDDDGLITKKVMSSGAKGIFFERGIPDRDVVYQKLVPQKTYRLDGEDKCIRLAAHYVGSRLAELTVTASKNIPVHGNSSSINYHVGLSS